MKESQRKIARNTRIFNGQKLTLGVCSTNLLKTQMNIELEVVADNKAAIALYHKVGFSDVGVYKKYWFANNIYSDAIIMQKSLDD